jgi:copper chaperone CopZ
VAERVLRRIPGVAAAYVNPANDTAYVDNDPSRCDPGDVRQRLAAAGYLTEDAV